MNPIPLVRLQVAKPLWGKAVFALWNKEINAFLKCIGFAVCHQLSGHSLSWGGLQMPLCARCTGIYSGLFFMTLSLFALRRLRRMRLPPVFAVALGLGFFAAMAADVFTDLMGWRATNNNFRLLTGALAGTTIPALGIPLANAIIWEKGGEEARILNTKEFLAFSGAVIVLVLGARIPNPFLFMAFSILSILGLVFFLLWINALALSGLLGSIRKSWMALGLMLLSTGELAFLNMVHRLFLRLQGIG